MLPGDLVRVAVPYCTMWEELGTESWGLTLEGGGIALILAVHKGGDVFIMYRDVLGWVIRRSLEAV